jgi:hypothetical protein
MNNFRYEAMAHRLRIEGTWSAGDRAKVRGAVDRFGCLAGGHLIVDLTAVAELDRTVAEDLIAAAHNASGRQSYAFLRKLHSSVDTVLTEAEAQAQSQTAAKARRLRRQGIRST